MAYHSVKVISFHSFHSYLVQPVYYGILPEVAHLLSSGRDNLLIVMILFLYLIHCPVIHQTSGNHEVAQHPVSCRLIVV